MISDIILDVFHGLGMTFPKPSAKRLRELQVIRKTLVTWHTRSPEDMLAQLGSAADNRGDFIGPLPARRLSMLADGHY